MVIFLVFLGAFAGAAIGAVIRAWLEVETKRLKREAKRWNDGP